MQPEYFLNRLPFACGLRRRGESYRDRVTVGERSFFLRSVVYRYSSKLTWCDSQRGTNGVYLIVRHVSGRDHTVDTVSAGSDRI